jgi:general secretion pathway protein E
MGQRLLRTLCPHCKEQHDLEDSAWEHLVSPWKAPKPKGTTYLAKGCLECRMTGYMGRMGIYETMVMTPDLRRVIAPEMDLAVLQERAYKEGMKPLRISGAMKVAAGHTTVDEVSSVAPPPSGDRRQHPR